MKKHRGPLSLASELESIDEVELSDKLESSSLNIHRHEDEDSLIQNVNLIKMDDKASRSLHENHSEEM